MVWLPKNLKEMLRDKINAQGDKLGISNMADRIADETVGVTEDEILAVPPGERTSSVEHGIYRRIIISFRIVCFSFDPSHCRGLM